MRRWIHDNSLSIALFGLFLSCLIAQSISGWLDYNADQNAHQRFEIGYTGYLTSGHFIESVFENWESEFLQDGAYVLLTAFLVQRGSAESKDPDADEPVDADPSQAQHDPNAPWPVRRGGLWLALYKNSLFLACLVLFAAAFALHAVGGARAYSEEQLEHGGQAVSMLEYLGTARFWFESFQNWQSEFLAVATLVLLSIFLRQQGSPESKPVASPHHQTGNS
ncbi:MAG: DUF6766 family protein [Roseiflexaceae bacterium]